MCSVKSSAYYTSETLANMLVSLIPVKRATRVLDLCVGSGNLLLAARRKWPTASLVGIDIDNKAIADCRRKFAKPAVFLRADARLLHPDTEGNPSQLKAGSFDIVLANPPFAGNSEPGVLGEHRNSGNRDLEGLPEKWESLSRRVEAMLLVYNLLYVRSGGYLAAIIPDSILSCDRFARLRKWLVDKSQRLLVVKLPANSFSQSEVAASAVILKRAQHSVPESLHSLLLQEARLSEGALSRRTLYRGTLDGSSSRLDVACIPDSHYDSEGRYGKLANLAPYIKRGTFIPKQSLRLSGSQLYLHSTNIKTYGLDTISAPQFVDDKVTRSGVLAECGDILMVRVGKTLGRVGIVTRKEQGGLISSCLYLIRPNGINSYSLALLLQSRISQTYYREIARGSAAKFLTYSDIRETPISLACDGVLKQIAERYEEILKSCVQSDKEKADRVICIQQLLDQVDRELSALSTI